MSATENPTLATLHPRPEDATEPTTTQAGTTQVVVRTVRNSDDGTNALFRAVARFRMGGA